MTIADALDKSYARLHHQLIRVAEEMPVQNYSFKPSPDVRTFGEQLRHIGAVQWVVGASIQGCAPPVDVGDGDGGPISMTAKAEILHYVRDSFAYIRHAINTINMHNALDLIPHPYDPENTKVERLVLVIGYACHGWDHYGQMIVYERLNGIVPPPSRPG
jgi:hypothetical protein